MSHLLFSAPCEYTRSCAILWYPKSAETKLELDGAVYHTFLSTTEWTQEIALRSAVLDGKGRSYCRIEVGLTEEEYDQIRDSLPENPMRTCCGNIAKLLEKNGIFKTSFLKGIWPTSFARHLWKNRNNPDFRIAKVEYVSREEKEFGDLLWRGSLPDALKTLLVVIASPVLAIFGILFLIFGAIKLLGRAIDEKVSLLA